MGTKSISDPNLFESFPKESQIDNPAGGTGGFVYQFPERTYRALDMNLVGLSRLKVNLKVTAGPSASSGQANFHIDTLDLYLDRARERFVQVAAERFTADKDEITQELYTLIEKLDQRRVEMLDKKTTEPATKEMSAAEREEALAFLRSPDLISEIQKDFDACGYIGEETPRLFGYLATVSRFLEKPLGILIVSRSGAGKSQLQDMIGKFVSEEQLHRYTRVTGQSLFYQEDGNLKYSVLSIAEEKGAEDAIYSIRTLQSDQYLTVAVTTTDPKTGIKRTEEYHVEGPVVIMITTTNPEALDFETRNRFVILTIDESREQTERILQRQRERYTLKGRLEKRLEDPIYQKHRNAQRLLNERVHVEIVNPYSLELTYPNDKLLMRREHEKYMTLINTITFLRQFQKPLKKTKATDGGEMEYVEVGIEDIALANQLAADVLGHSLDELSPHTRTLLKSIKAMVDQEGKRDMVFSRKEICEKTGWSYWQIHTHLKQLVDMEYLLFVGGGDRNRYQYQLLWDGKGESGERFVSGLIDVETLKKRKK